MFDRLVVKLLLAAFFVCGLSASAVTSFARSSDINGDEPKNVVGNSGLKLGQAEALRQFEEASRQEYTLGAGDQIEIQVPGQPELQGSHTLGPDGRITLPLVGPMVVSGKTREEAAQMITKAWLQYYSTISATVQVTKYASNRITVVGRVSAPGPQYFDTPPTLLEALSKSGAYSARPVEPLATGGVKSNNQAAAITRCAVYRGGEQVLWINMNELFTSGNGVDLHLRRDDVVYVPDEQEALVSVLGQVQHPGAIRISPDTTLASLLAMAGGFTEDAARKNIQIVRPSTNTSREVSFDDLINPAKARAIEASLQSGDVVWVPKSGMGKFGYVLNKFSPAGSLLMFGAAVHP